jgi:hypothetical protein
MANQLQPSQPKDHKECIAGEKWKPGMVNASADRFLSRDVLVPTARKTELCGRLTTIPFNEDS